MRSAASLDAAHFAHLKDRVRDARAIALLVDARLGRSEDTTSPLELARVVGQVDDMAILLLELLREIVAEATS